MGEIADAMINGEMCEMCGVPLGGEAMGFPRYCSRECAKDRGAEYISYESKDLNPNNTISVKITYNGNKVFHVKAHDNTFNNAIDIANYITKYIEQALDITPNFKHPKMEKSNG